MSSIRIRRRENTVTLILTSPILEQDLLRELIETLRDLAGGSSPLPIVLGSSHPTIFLAGADLGEIAELDHRTCIAYAGLGRVLGDHLASHPTPVVAAVHGSCSGGGFDLVMACDEVIAGPEASFSHPGVHRGLVTGWGGTGRLAEHLRPGVLRRALLEGNPLDAPAMKALGAVRKIDEDPLSAAQAAARELAGIHPARLSCWRHLTGPSFVDRFRAFVVEKS